VSKPFSTILQDLHHPDISTRSRAVFALDKLGDEQFVLDELLTALATEKDLLVREDITWALVRRKETAIQPLIVALQSENWQLRHNAAHVLGKIASPIATDALIAVLPDENAIVVTKAAFALSQIGDTKSIPALVALLGHENREIQTMLLTVLEGFGEAALRALAQAIQAENWKVREEAADVLGHIPSEESLTLLTQALQDEVWQVRFAAVTALSYHGAKEAIAPLQNDPNEQVRKLARQLMANRRI
jgi:HEAT repeat protein